MTSLHENSKNSIKIFYVKSVTASVLMCLLEAVFLRDQRNHTMFLAHHEHCEINADKNCQKKSKVAFCMNYNMDSDNKEIGK